MSRARSANAVSAVPIGYTQTLKDKYPGNRHNEQKTMGTGHNYICRNTTATPRKKEAKIREGVSGWFDAVIYSKTGKWVTAW